jgi:hypothetical protein
VRPTLRTVKAIAVLMLFLTVPLSALAAGATVSAGATPRTVKKGEVVALPVTIAGVSGLYGFEAQLRFDSTVVRVVDADPGKAGVQLLPGDFLALDFLVRNAADNDAGVAEFVVTQLNPSKAKSGSGTLFTVYFEGVAEGKRSVISLVELKLASRDGDEIPATSVNGEISVEAASSVPAAASPTPWPPAPSPVLDMDELTATPLPTALPTVAELATATAVLTAPVPATEGVTATAVIPATAAQTTEVSSTATLSSTSAAVAQGAAEQPPAVTTEMPGSVGAATTPGRIARLTSEPILSETPGSPAEAGAAAAPVGLLAAGAILLALGALALALLIALRVRRGRS